MQLFQSQSRCDCHEEIYILLYLKLILRGRFDRTINNCANLFMTNATRLRTTYCIVKYINRNHLLSITNQFYLWSFKLHRSALPTLNPLPTSRSWRLVIREWLICRIQLRTLNRATTMAMDTGKRKDRENTANSFREKGFL